MLRRPFTASLTRCEFLEHQMNDSQPVTSHQSPGGDGHLSEQEAVRITQQDEVPALTSFVAALEMGAPVSTDKAARLLKHMVKEQMSMDAGLIADQMRHDQWESHLSGDETVIILADRALTFLATQEGVVLFNFFVKTFAGTNGTMFD